MPFDPEEIAHNRALLDQGLSSQEVLAYNAELDRQIAAAITEAEEKQFANPPVPPETLAPQVDMSSEDSLRQFIDREIERAI